MPVIELSYWLAPLVAAPFVGSFIGVLIRRLPAGRPVTLARSACEHCGATLTVRDLVPLASYLWLRGRCRYCGEAIGAFHLTVELAAVGIAVWASLAEIDPDRLWADCLLGWALLALGWIDWRCMRLPDALTLPLLLVGLFVTSLLQPGMLFDHTAAAVIGYLMLRAVAWAYLLARGREGIGAGDAKLLAAGGAWLGMIPLPLVVLTASLLGLVLAGLLVLSGRSLRATTALPFGPCLALAIYLYWLHGAWLMNSGIVPWLD